MKRIEQFVSVFGRLVLLAMALLLSHAALAGSLPQHFAVLQIGTTVYQNVTVTTKADTYIVFSHAEGLGSAKVAQLSDSQKEQLGYARTPAPKANSTNSAGKALASKAMALVQKPFGGGAGPGRGAVGSKLVLSLLGAGLMLHLFFALCCKLICEKAGADPGVLVWVPGLQPVPLFRAAGMSGWWYLSLFVPLLCLVPAFVWPFKIAETRGKTVWTAVLLLVPVTHLFAFLYLAFSTAAEPKEERRIEIMTLEAA
jgi:hypothetical protein